MIQSLGKVTVCIPTYNRAHMIRRALNCALGQTYRDLDVLVYDDCSTDNTEKVVKGYDSRVRYVRGTDNLKECRVRSIMVDMVSADYIAWLDSDDLCNKHRVLMQVTAMNDHNAPWSRVDGEVFRKDQKIDWKEFPRSRERLEFLTPSTVVRTDVAREHRHKPYLFGCDTVWELEALLIYKTGIVIHRILYYYMMHDPARVSKIYPHRPSFEAEMADQRKRRQELLDRLEAEGIPHRGTTLSEEYTRELVKKCCS